MTSTGKNLYLTAEGQEVMATLPEGVAETDVDLEGV